MRVALRTDTGLARPSANVDDDDDDDDDSGMYSGKSSSHSIAALCETWPAAWGGERRRRGRWGRRGRCAVVGGVEALGAIYRVAHRIGIIQKVVVERCTTYGISSARDSLKEGKNA